VLGKINKNISDSFWYTFGEILNKVSVFLLIPFYTSFFTKEQYGLLSVVIIITTFSNHIISYASKTAFLRIVYDYAQPGKNRLVFTVISNLVMILIGLTVIVGVIHAIAITNDLSFLPYFKYVYIVLLYSLFFSINNIALSILRVERKVKQFTLYNLFKTLLEIGFVIFFVNFLTDGVFGKVIGSFLTMLLLSIIMYIFIIKRNISFHYDKTISKQYLKFASPLVVNNILGWALVSYDQMLFETNFGLKEFAILSLALQICSIYKFSMEGVLRAFNVYLYEKMNKIKKSLKDFFTFFVSLFSIGAVVLLMFQEYIILIISSEEYMGATQTIDYYIFSRFLMLMNVLLAFLLLMDKNSKDVTKSTVVAAISMLIFSTYLIPNYGLVGAALSATITFFVGNIFLTVRLNKTIKIYSYKSIFAIVAFMLIVGLKIVLDFTLVHKILCVLLILGVSYYLNKDLLKKILG